MGASVSGAGGGVAPEYQATAAPRLPQVPASPTRRATGAPSSRTSRHAWNLFAACGSQQYESDSQVTTIESTEQFEIALKKSKDKYS